METWQSGALANPGARWRLAEATPSSIAADKAAGTKHQELVGLVLRYNQSINQSEHHMDASYQDGRPAPSNQRWQTILYCYFSFLLRNHSTVDRSSWPCIHSRSGIITHSWSPSSMSDGEGHRYFGIHISSGAKALVRDENTYNISKLLVEKEVK